MRARRGQEEHDGFCRTTVRSFSGIRNLETGRASTSWCGVSYLLCSKMSSGQILPDQAWISQLETFSAYVARVAKLDRWIIFE